MPSNFWQKTLTWNHDLKLKLGGYKSDWNENADWTNSSRYWEWNHIGVLTAKAVCVVLYFESVTQTQI
jgi:hypothetical protein